MDTAPEDSSVQRIHAAYLEYNKTLRAWLVGYGVGVPLVLITQSHLLDKVSDSGLGTQIGYLFLAGVLLQVLMAFLNKWSNWYRYTEKAHARTTAALTKTAHFIRNHPGIDLSSEVLAIILFAIATALTFHVILEGAP